ncbi:MAG: serine hydrolase [Magnetococcales bacterium]|nr:serine hydrolase [Magnetococcales bacterium]
MMRIFGLALVLVMSGMTAVWAAPPPLPVTASNLPWSPLYEQVDEAMQEKLIRRLRENRAWARLMDRGKMAVGLVDLSHPLQPRFARINGRSMMYAASLPKIAILLAAFQQFEEGTLERTKAINADLAAMIRVSSNAAATRMIDRLGGLDRVNQVLTDPRYHLYDETLGGGLWVGKRYQQAGRRRPDPIHGLSHGATVTQVCRFFYLLATGRLVNPQRSQEMLDLLVDPKINHKFVKALRRAAPEAKIYRKSGTWKIWHADAALVWGPQWRRYILVGMVEDTNGENILQALVPAIETVLPLAPNRATSNTTRTGGK